MDIFKSPNLQVGFETSDDAGVFKIDEEKSIVQTLDFITPVVDDAYIFGRISAINSLSDLYAMGAEPITALSILMYNCDIDNQIITEMMQGACDEFKKVNCTLLGGHTVDDLEVKLGFSVTGLIKDKFYRNSTLRESDVLIYTKPLGIGIVSTALKGELASEQEISEIQDIMLLSNYNASKIFKKYDVSACTDITGFGLAGHALEMAKGADKTIVFYTDKINILKSALNYAGMGIIPEGAYFNKQFMIYDYEYKNSDKDKEIVMFDPQTSGGLLIGVSEKDSKNLLNNLIDIGYEQAQIIGGVRSQTNSKIIFD